MLEPGTLLEESIAQARALGASDLHITVESPPCVRVDGALRRLEMDPLPPAAVEALVRTVMKPERGRELEARGSANFAFGSAGEGRYRAHVFRQRGALALAVRLIPPEPPALETLELPEIVAELAMRPHGLVLVAGPAGSGKSTTLAGMVDRINRMRSCHVVTLEDPVEYLHRHRMSIVHQREIGDDAPSFAEGLAAALRQDPDVLLIAELRDPETIAAALAAAETGHLVLASVRARGAASAVERIVDAFPPHRQNRARLQLADTLQGVVAQALLPRPEGGRTAVAEVLVGIPKVRDLIRAGKERQLSSLMQAGARFGMQTMAGALDRAVEEGRVRRADAENLKEAWPALAGRR
ncbi:MAG: PilT/PilU family type 4a pilus ATPase [Firmicutes bacterium]|nr:PilT/PilU family type 4a pilus ATPase [Bacillota bacterium]